MGNKWLTLGIIAVLFVAFLAWLFIESSKPLPGEKIADLGRGHVPIGENVEYNSNPPTSGKHYNEWIRSGIYEELKDDRNLVHSLEHGYIIMHYKCPLPPKEGGVTLEMSGTESSPAGTVTPFTPSPGDQVDVQKECNERKDQLAKIYEKKGKKKLIVVPRLGLDTNFALTAWNYIDKFDEFDQVRVEKFIDAHLNQGPEKTME